MWNCNRAPRKNWARPLRSLVCLPLLATLFVATARAQAPAGTPWSTLGKNLQHTGLADHFNPVPNGGTPAALYVAGISYKANPAVDAGGNVYVCAVNRADPTRRGLTCLDKDLNWRWSAGLDPVLIRYGTDGRPLYNTIEGGQTPAIGPDGTLYVATQNSTDATGAYSYDRLYAVHEGVDSSTGAPIAVLKWSFKTGGQCNGSITVAPDGTILFGTNTGFIYAVKPDGTLRWRYQTGGAVEGGAAFSAADGGTFFIGSQDKNLYAMNLATGTVKWKARLGDYVLSAPAIDSAGSIYVVAGNFALWCLTPTGGTKWKTQMKSESWVTSSSHPAIDEGRGAVYAGGGDAIYAFDRTTGRIKWKVPQTHWIDGHFAIDNVDGTLYVGNRGNDGLSAISPTGTVKWVRAGDYLVSAPAVGPDGTLYATDFSTGGGIRAFR